METIYNLRQLEIDVGGGALACLPHATPLRVEFIYDAGYPDVHTAPNGDPGEPGLPESFDFKRIINLDRLVLADANDSLLLLIAPGTDLYDFLSQQQLDAIGQAALREVRARQAEARLDAHLGALE